jgi:hypothetical protein
MGLGYCSRWDTSSSSKINKEQSRSNHQSDHNVHEFDLLIECYFKGDFQP